MNEIYVEALNYAKGIWRNRWMAVITAWVVCVMGWAGVVLMPDQFESEARIYVDTNSLLAPLLKGISVDSDVADKVMIMQRTLLSRPNLEQVMRMNDLDLTVEGPKEVEALINRLAEKIKVETTAANLFSIRYANPNPKSAQAVVQSLLTIFVENNLGKSRVDMESARSFIEKQITDYERQLRAAEERRAVFMAKNGRYLSSGSFAQKLESGVSDRRKATLELQDALTRRDELLRQLASIPPRVESDDALQILAGQAGSGNSIGARIAATERTLDSLLLQYTEKHPDVAATQRLLASLKKQQADAPQGSGLGRPNPLYENVKIMLIEAETNIASLQRKVADAQSVEDENRKMMSEAPRVEAEFKDIDRDYTVLKANYDELLTRRESARISQAQEAETSTVQYRVIDPPLLPIVAASPNRPLLYALVLVLSIGAGGGIAFLRASLEDSIVSSSQLADFGFPVLGRITLVLTAVDELRNRKENWQFGLASGSLAASYILVSLVGPNLVTLAARLGGRSISAMFGGAV